MTTKPAPDGVAGHALREARRRAGLSGSQLGAASGMSKSAISAIETGRSNPTIDTLIRIAVGLDADFLVGFRLHNGAEEILHTSRGETQAAA